MHPSNPDTPEAISAFVSDTTINAHRSGGAGESNLFDAVNQVDDGVSILP
ncbi:MAG: hypothetical protein O7F17_09610 [Planctomycetota bacterium]|nr:hypothetical protein [Planctomycetota bacterium]MCZ6543490.1 hypothetical protein [Planctomycetota bacterium]MCZ6851885.1 hypothetical protein [Planctomycetota bacterium]